MRRGLELTCPCEPPTREDATCMVGSRQVGTQGKGRVLISLIMLVCTPSAGGVEITETAVGIQGLSGSI